MSCKFLIDSHLPFKFGLWNNEEYLHVFKLGENLSDEEIWDYALKNNLTIITKDSDFSDKILFHKPPPKVIHLKFGNMRMRDFHAFINSIWPEVIRMSDSHKLVNVYSDRIEGID